MVPGGQVVEPTKTGAASEGESYCVHSLAYDTVEDAPSARSMYSPCEHKAGRSGSVPDYGEE